MCRGPRGLLLAHGSRCTQGTSATHLAPRQPHDIRDLIFSFLSAQLFPSVKPHGSPTADKHEGAFGDKVGVFKLRQNKRNLLACVKSPSNELQSWLGPGFIAALLGLCFSCHLLPQFPGMLA